MSKNKFGSLLKQKRTTLNLSQNKVAELCHLSKSSYSHLERGIRYPSFETLIKLSEVLDADPRELIYAIIPHEDDINTDDINTIEELSPEDSMCQKSFFDSFNKLNPHEQKVIIDIMDSIIESNTEIPR
ncbi:MAG: helix-turn-helix transcriptional regulator [Lachnospiraceae bacterium]|nr:helix-turn-helix transcriptional regulator [Lachnospiraceae bacterium]